MRSTITLDDDVFKKIKELVHQSGKPAKQVYNELLRAALIQKMPPTKQQKKFKLVTFQGKNGLLSGFNWDMSHAQMMDKLDEEERKK